MDKTNSKDKINLRRRINEQKKVDLKIQNDINWL